MRSTARNDEANAASAEELGEDLGVEDEEEEEEEEEFTPSAWNAALAPHRSALRSPDKTIKSGVSIKRDKRAQYKETYSAFVHPHRY